MGLWKCASCCRLAVISSPRNLARLDHHRHVAATLALGQRVWFETGEGPKLGPLPTNRELELSMDAVTGVLAIFTFLIVLIVGFWRHGLHFFSLFVPHGTPLPMVATIALCGLIALAAAVATLRSRPGAVPAAR